MKPACLRGLDAIRASSKPRRISVIGAGEGQYLVLHINDPHGLVAHEKGSGVAWASMSLVPEFVTNKIYSTVKEQLQQQFKEKGSDVTVDIVQTPPRGEKPSSDLVGGMFLGSVLSALGYIGLKLLRRKK